MEIITSEKKLPKYIRKVYGDPSYYIKAQRVPIKPDNKIIRLPYLLWNEKKNQVAVFIKTSDDIFDHLYTNIIKGSERVLSDCIDRTSYSIVVGLEMSYEELKIAREENITVLNMSSKGLKLYRNE